MLTLIQTMEWIKNNIITVNTSRLSAYQLQEIGSAYDATNVQLEVLRSKDLILWFMMKIYNRQRGKQRVFISM